MDFIPDQFLMNDIEIDSERHLIFETLEMLNLLNKAKQWYVDGMFKVVKPPFAQLFYIHSFVKRGTGVKQLQSLFVLMSGPKEYSGVPRKDARK